MKTWLARFRPRPVTLSSPHPPDECFRRLTGAATRRGTTSWYLDPRTVGRPEPRLLGTVGPSQISVTRWHDQSGRNSWIPRLDARLEPGAGGTTALTGTIGLYPAVRALLLVFAGVGGLLWVVTAATGTALLIRGNLGGLPVVLVPSALAASFVGMNVAGLRSLERDIPGLVQEINGILDSTVAFFVGTAEELAAHEGCTD